MSKLDLNPIAQAFHTIYSIPPEDTRLANLCREMNLFTNVLRVQGQRDLYSIDDLRTLFMRMCDIAAIEPYEAAEARRDHPTDLDRLQKAIAEKPKPGVFKLTATKQD